MMAVDVGVFIIARWVYLNVSSINKSCDTRKACDVSEFRGNTKRPARPSYEHPSKANYCRDKVMNDMPYC